MLDHERIAKLVERVEVLEETLIRLDAALGMRDSLIVHLTQRIEKLEKLVAQHEAKRQGDYLRMKAEYRAADEPPKEAE